VTESALQISGEQAVEQLFSRLAAHREPTGAIGARFQAALNILADAEVFVLYAVTDSDALRVVLTPGLADVFEVEIENYAAMIDVERDDQIGVHVPRIAVDHEVRILPEVPGSIALTRCPRHRIFV